MKILCLSLSLPSRCLFCFSFFLTQSLLKVTLQSNFFFFLAKKISKVDFLRLSLCQKHTFIHVNTFLTRQFKKVTRRTKFFSFCGNSGKNISINCFQTTEIRIKMRRFGYSSLIFTILHCLVVKRGKIRAVGHLNADNRQ